MLGINNHSPNRFLSKKLNWLTALYKLSGAKASFYHYGLPVLYGAVSEDMIRNGP